MTDAEREQEEYRVTMGLNEILANETPEQRAFYQALESLLERQDKKTCAEIDSANCGRTPSDRRAVSVATFLFEESLLAFLRAWFPKIVDPAKIKQDEQARIMAAMKEALR